jgi:hypothetical protein
MMLDAPHEATKLFGGQAARLDLELCVSSGLFDICLEMDAWL